MFWFYVLLTLVTYPFVCIGSIILLLIMAMLSGMGGNSDMDNPFISPNTLYKFYKNTPFLETFKSFTFGTITLGKWFSDLKAWYKRESS